MDLDEWIFALLGLCNEKWTAHVSDSDAEAEKEKMKKEIALQKEQIASQVELLGMLRSQQEKTTLEMEEMKRQTREVTILRETVQKLLESQAAAAATSSDSAPKCATGECLNTHTAEAKGALLDAVAGEGETMTTMEDENSRQGQIIASQSQREAIIMPPDIEQEKEESRE